MMEQQSEARTMKASLQGVDPFRQAAVLGGGVTRGTTPAMQFNQELQGIIDMDIPQMSLSDSIPEMEATLESMKPFQMPTQSPFMGEGGTVKGPFSTKKQSYIVGERGPEVMTVSKDKVEITPFGGGYAAGGSVARGKLKDWKKGSPGAIGPWPPGKKGELPRGLPVSEEEKQRRQNLLAMKQALAPLYAGMGLSRVPSTSRGGGLNLPSAQAMGPFSNKLDMLSAFGVTPQLVKGPDGSIYYVENGVLRRFRDMSQFKELGFQMGDVMKLGGAAMGEFEMGQGITGKMPIVPPETTFGQGALGSPLIEPTSGIMLPALHKIAGTWLELSPTERLNARSAYESALMGTGMSQSAANEAIDSIIAGATPSAGAFGRRIGYTGGFAG
jgi:hypothetical protein